MKAKPYIVLIRKRGNWRRFSTYSTEQSARMGMTNINVRNLNKLYKRCENRKRKPSYEEIANVYAKTAIQYFE